MHGAQPSAPSASWTETPGQLRIWHLALLVLFVAVAIVNIQDQGRGEPALIALASAGFLGYGFLGWLGWRAARGYEARLGPTPRLIFFLVAMAALFLVATMVYLAIEHGYLNGGF
jgi:hypothetical protein